MRTPTDVVLVGGGIAGASLAQALARGGLGVTVLEASSEFPDRVRGESMQCWGVAEARTLGVEQVLLDAGAHTATVWNQYDEGVPDPAPIPMNIMVPGIDGSLNLRHPDVCQALLDAAASAGATVIRGVSKVELANDAPWTVTYENDGRRERARPPRSSSARMVGTRPSASRSGSRSSAKTPSPSSRGCSSTASKACPTTSTPFRAKGRAGSSSSTKDPVEPACTSAPVSQASTASRGPKGRDASSRPRR